LLSRWPKHLPTRVPRRMDSYRRQQIRAKAQALLDDAGITGLPVDPKAIAQHLDIIVAAKPAHIAGASGWLVRAGESFAIIYATHIANLGFQRFSIAHELGHYWIDTHPEHIFKNGGKHESHAGFGSADPIELEADYFAACLLMPSSLCLRLISKSRDGMDAVKTLAVTCETSLSASAIRYAELSKVPSAIIVSTNGIIDYCFDSNLRREIGWPSPLKRGTRVSKNSATDRLANDANSVVQATEDSDSGSASDWFFGAEAKTSLIEEAVGLGSYGKVLTLLTLEELDEDDQESEWEEPRFRR